MRTETRRCARQRCRQKGKGKIKKEVREKAITKKKGNANDRTREKSR